MLKYYTLLNFFIKNQKLSNIVNLAAPFELLELKINISRIFVTRNGLD